MFDKIFGETQTITLKLIECANCGMPFGVTESFQNRRRDDHKGFMCPNGHSNVYNGKTEAEKLREQLERSANREKSLSLVIDRQRDTIQSKDHVIRATRAAKTRLKNRIAAGVCPCCNRTFQDLARHMQGKHPEFKLA